MLAGIGGATIAEAKERLTYEEVLTWCEYIKNHGPLDLHGRLEYGFALVAHQIHQSVGGKAKFEAFAPYLSRQVTNDETQTKTVDEEAQAIMLMLASLAKGKKT